MGPLFMGTPRASVFAPGCWVWLGPPRSWPFSAGPTHPPSAPQCLPASLEKS